MLVQERDSGAAVLLVSVELDEIFALSDRIAVMFAGRLMAVMDAADANEQDIGILMAGGSLEKPSVPSSAAGTAEKIQQAL